MLYYAKNMLARCWTGRTQELQGWYVLCKPKTGLLLAQMSGKSVHSQCSTTTLLPCRRETRKAFAASLRGWQRRRGPYSAGSGCGQKCAVVSVARRGGGGELSSVKQLAYPLQGPPAPLRKAPQVRETPLCVRDTGLFDLLRTAVLTAVTVFLPRAKRSRCAGPACRCRDSPPRVLRREA